MRLVAPYGGILETDAPSGRRHKGNIFETSDAADIKALRREGYTVASATDGPVQTDGFVCTSCGFRAYFKKCSRCTGDCERPDVL